MTRPLRFGLHSIGTDPATDARRAEDAGFGVLTVADHVVDGMTDPWVALTAAAAASETIRLGTLVLNNDFHNPWLLARAALTLDATSGGRLELGLGAGHGWPEYEAIGVDFDEAAVRIARLRQSIDVLDRLLRGDADGRLPAPTQAPRMPLLVGGNAKSILRLGAERCDTVGMTGSGRTMEDGLHHEATGFRPDAVDERIGVIRDVNPDVEVNVLVQWVTITDDPRREAEKLVRRAPYLTVDDVLGAPYVWLGSEQSIRDDIAEYRERWGITYFTIFSRDIDAATPVVTALAPG
jgi:probable F420-dependent oxidoreductase